MQQRKKIGDAVEMVPGVPAELAGFRVRIASFSRDADYTGSEPFNSYRKSGSVPHFVLVELRSSALHSRRCAAHRRQPPEE